MNIINSLIKETKQKAFVFSPSLFLIRLILFQLNQTTKTEKIYITIINHVQ